ncbi:alpha/beta hydrolase fold domain-containing protein [Treponema sp.]|uniref:alpha/beta hydrolase fold domain-containing protein n=1 Tax=Treponema sp. TaxID=166 RepID=UPI003F0A32A4
MEIKLDRRAAVKKLKALVFSPKNEVEIFRSKLEKKFKSDFIPNHVELSEKNIGGVKCDVLVPELCASSRVIVYVHGGSFVGGSRDSWRSFCSILANAASSKVVVPEFRLAPSYPFPASMEDVEKVLGEILDSENFSEVILAADGSGASIAMGLMLRTEEKKRSMVSKIVLFSPWLNFCGEKFSDKKIRDEVLSSEDIRHAAGLYTYSSNLENVQVSPLKASEEEFSNFPEVYIQCGEKEILLEDAETLNQRVLYAGGKCTLDVWPGMMFMFQMADEFLLESHSAVEKVGHYINKQSGLSDDEIKERERLMRENNMTVE